MDRSYLNMSKSPLFRVSDLKTLKFKDFQREEKDYSRNDPDPEHQGDKYMGQYSSRDPK